MPPTNKFAGYLGSFFIVKDSFTEKVDCQVKNVNKTEGDFLMTLHEKLQNERAEGIEQGTSKEKIATVKRMAKKNDPSYIVVGKNKVAIFG